MTTTISYFNKLWRSGARYRNEEAVGTVLDPQPQKPLFRPGWQISFSWTEGEVKQGKIWQAQRDTKTGATWYTVKVDKDKDHHVPEEDVLQRIEEAE